MSNSNLPANSEFLLYQTQDGRIRIRTRMHDNTLWLTINQMAESCGVDNSGISRHLTNIFETGEATVAKFATVQSEASGPFRVRKRLYSPSESKWGQT